MGFYDSNEKNAFATAGAIHDGTSTDTGSTAAAPDAASPNGTAALSAEQARSGLAGNTDPGTGQFYEGNVNPFTDPDYAGGGDPKAIAMRAQGLAFDAGGAMPDDGDDDKNEASGSGDDNNANPIDALFAHLRQKSGLMQMAGAIPTTPGGQSESGVKPLQPFGTLPPTSNPFGKRPTPPRPGQQMSEVVPYPSPGGPGPTTAATPYYMGTKKDPKVAPIPLGKSADAGAIPEGDEEEAA